MSEIRKKRVRRPWFRELAIIAAVFVAISWWQTRDLPASGTAPKLTAGLSTLDGSPFSWHAPAGESETKLTLVYAFAPWCGVCKMSSSNLRWLAAIFGPGKLRIVPLALDYDKPEEVRAYADENPFPAPVVLGNDATQQALRVGAYPTYFVLDRGGRIKHTSVGYSTFLGMLFRTLSALTNR